MDKKTIPQSLIDEAWRNATEIKYKPNRQWLEDLKVGDPVCRMICGTHPMMLKVTSIIGNTIECGLWKFSMSWGLEIDEDLTADGTPATLVISFIRELTKEELESEKADQLDNKQG